MVNFIFDTDMGNDIDDALALTMLALEHGRGAVNLALTVSSNSNPISVAMIAAVNARYGAGGTPVAIRPDKSHYAEDTHSYCKKGIEACGFDPSSVVAEDAVKALRRVLASLPDGSVRVVATGFASNLARLLDSPANFNGDGIEDGLSLTRRKVSLLSIMAGDFTDAKNQNGERRAEFNVVGDIPAMRRIMDAWPSLVVISEFFIGENVLVDWSFLDKRMKDSNPVKAAYSAFYQGKPGARPSWDQTSMLYALEPDAGHFALSEEGDVAIDEKGRSDFHPRKGGARRLLRFDEKRTPETVNKTLHERFYREP